MSLEDRIRSSVDTALEDLRTRVEADMHALVDQLVTAAAQERDEAIQATRKAAFDEAWQGAQREAADSNARSRAVHEQALSEARAEERAGAEQRSNGGDRRDRGADAEGAPGDRGAGRARSQRSVRRTGNAGCATPNAVKAGCSKASAASMAPRRSAKCSTRWRWRLPAKSRAWPCSSFVTTA